MNDVLSENLCGRCLGLPLSCVREKNDHHVSPVIPHCRLKTVCWGLSCGTDSPLRTWGCSTRTGMVSAAAAAPHWGGETREVWEGYIIVNSEGGDSPTNTHTHGFISLLVFDQHCCLPHTYSPYRLYLGSAHRSAVQEPELDAASGDPEGLIVPPLPKTMSHILLSFICEAKAPL